MPIRYNAAMTRYFALVPAAGSGSRMGDELPKQYLPLAGRPLLFHALAALCANTAIVRVFVVLAPEDRYWPQHDWSALAAKLCPLFCGGATRAASVLAGLRTVSGELAAGDWVLVHDAARPCLSAAQLEHLVRELGEDPVGGVLAAPVADTLKQADAAQRIEATVSRDGLWQAQTPQMFRYGVLRRALEATQEVTDEAGAVEALGLRPRLVASDMTNLKVTYPLDLPLAEWILRQPGRR
jgi:2-C-methyl-D-erythritol 4-phosphate cytidylyltransferase